MIARIPLRRLLPFLQWFPVTGGTLRADLLAGITVALVLIPQSMAYAQLAGMPAYYGLYAALLPVLVGALWGSSQQLSTGPVAVVSLLTASALAPLAAPSTAEYIALAILLALMVGIVQLSLGFFRLGAIVNLLSHPVVSGFTNAAAIIIALSQLAKLIGVPMSRSEYFMLDIYGVLQQIGDAHLPTVIMGVSSLVLMLVMRRYFPKLPAVLIAVLLATVISWQSGYSKEMKVDLSAIQARVAGQIAQEYIAGQETLRELEQQLAARRLELRKVGPGDPPSRRVLLSHQVELAELRRDEAILENDARFRSLRSVKFVAVQNDAGGTYLYNAQSDIAKQLVREEKPTLWRIKKLDRAAVYLTSGGEVVGAIPPGLPSLSVPRIDWANVASLVMVALVIALVGFMEAISIAKAMAAQTRSRIDPNQEFIGQGLANIAGSFSQSFPVSGSFSRSAVNLNAGAVTGLSSVFTGLLVLITLLFLTSLLYYLPQSVLAAVIMLAVFGLVNLKSLKHAWDVHRHDGIAAIVTFIATLAFAPHLDNGIIMGAVVAIALFVRRRMRPRAEILGQFPDGVLAGMDTNQLPPISDNFIVMRYDGELTFINVNHFEDMVLEALMRFPKAKALLLEGSGINEIDVSGEEKLAALALRLRDTGVTLYISSLKNRCATCSSAAISSACCRRSGCSNPPPRGYGRCANCMMHR